MRKKHSLVFLESSFETVLFGREVIVEPLLEAKKVFIKQDLTQTTLFCKVASHSIFMMLSLLVRKR